MTPCIFYQALQRRLQKFLPILTLNIDLFSQGLLIINLHLCIQSVVVHMLSKNYSAVIFTALLLNAQPSLWFCPTKVNHQCYFLSTAKCPQKLLVSGSVEFFQPKKLSFGMLSFLLTFSVL